MKFCPMCGTNRPEPARFCPSCGFGFEEHSADQGGSTQSSLVDRAMSIDESARVPARGEIIDSCDIRAMSECAVRAEAMKDAADAEFWWLEVATASASDEVISLGVYELCERVLLPQGRFEEAELYCRHLETRQTPEGRDRGRAMLRRLDQMRTRLANRRLLHSEAWRQVNVYEPGTFHRDQQAHYDRAYAFLCYFQGEGKLDLLLEADQQAFLPNITGYLIGQARGDSATRIGMDRDTMAKALCDWLVNNRSPHVSSGEAPAPSDLAPGRRTSGGLRRSSFGL